MPRSRRDFLKNLWIAASCGAVLHLIDAPFSVLGRTYAAPLGADRLKTLADLAFKRAKERGCVYADILINGYRTGRVLRATSSACVESRESNPFTTVIESANFRLRVRAIHSGSCGIAESPNLRNSDIPSLMAQAVAHAQAKANHTERFISHAPVTVFRERCIPMRQRGRLDALINEQIVGLMAAGDRAMTFRAEETYFASTRGDYSCTTRLCRL